VRFVAMTTIGCRHFWTTASTTHVLSSGASLGHGGQQIGLQMDTLRNNALASVAGQCVCVFLGAALSHLALNIIIGLGLTVMT
jgi:hypothetical protein